MKLHNSTSILTDNVHLVAQTESLAHSVITIG